MNIKIKEGVYYPPLHNNAVSCNEESIQKKREKFSSDLTFSEVLCRSGSTNDWETISDEVFGINKSKDMVLLRYWRFNSMTKYDFNY